MTASPSSSPLPSQSSPKVSGIMTFLIRGPSSGEMKCQRHWVAAAKLGHRCQPHPRICILKIWWAKGSMRESRLITLFLGLGSSRVCSLFPVVLRTICPWKQLLSVLYVMSIGTHTSPCFSGKSCKDTFCSLTSGCLAVGFHRVLTFHCQKT